METVYHITLENNSDVNKAVDFHKFSWQNVVVRFEDLETGENRLYSSGELPEIPDESIEQLEEFDQVLASLSVPAKSVKRYRVTITFVTAQAAPIKHYMNVRQEEA